MHGTPQWVCRANKKWNWTRRSIISLDFWVTTTPREGRKFLKTTTQKINLPRPRRASFALIFILTSPTIIWWSTEEEPIPTCPKENKLIFTDFSILFFAKVRIFFWDHSNLDPPRRENAVAGLRMFLRPILARQIDLKWNYSWRSIQLYL